MTQDEHTQKWAEFPSLFIEERQPDSDYIFIPRVSSENRKYIPIGYVSKEIIISEGGAAFKDELINGVVDDVQRIDYFQQYIGAVLKAKKEGVNVNGYFAWTLTDNFEWSEGYAARFGLIHIDFKTQLRTIKNSGYWFRDFLRG